MTPRYPVYIISKGRSTCCLTAKILRTDGVPFCLVIEPQEADLYVEQFDRSLFLILPFSNLGLGSIPARNWVWEHALSSGEERHWIIDDNIQAWYRRVNGIRIPCNAKIALAAIEDFADRYQNVAIAGCGYEMFLPEGTQVPPFIKNAHVYSNNLILNRLPYRWRGRYNEDTDLCLQVLAGGWCTVQVMAFLVKKTASMKMHGGNSAELYKGDGRLKMARSLERLWPGVVSVARRYGRPQHIVNWTKFDTQLKLKPGVVIDPMPNEYGMKLTQVKPIKSEIIRELFNQQI